MSLSDYTPWLGVLGAMGLGAVAYYNLAHGGGRIDPLVDLQNQTMEISTAQRERVSRIVKDGKLSTRMFDDALTLYEGFRRGARVSDNGPCLGYRKKLGDGSMPYQWIRYNEVLERAGNLAAGFLAKGLQPGQDTYVGIYATNGPEWIITEQACYVYSNVIVPLYDTLGPEACSYIINQADIRLVICDKSNKAEGLLDECDKCPSLKLLVVIEELTDVLKEKSAKKNVEVISFDALIKLGASDAKKLPHQPPKPDDLATICYTSGTTGLPKGVMLTHANVIANCSGLGILKNTPLSHEDVIISYLPLAHMFERIIEAIGYMVGAKVGFFQGDIRSLTDDIKVLRPTLVPVVPRLLNRIYDKVMSDVGKSGIKKFLLDWALDAKAKDLKKHIVKNNTFWDKLVFRKIRDAMGGSVRIMITGSAPLGENVLTFIRASMGCVILEGYGQTECVAAATCTLEGDHKPGHVGPPLPCCKVKLVDVPEMEYYAKNGQGEVCIYGPNVFKGYFKDPEKTAEALDSDGWLHTGDIGRWTPEGTLKIIDRKKHIFKLAQGEYIAPEKIENAYLQSKFVSQAYVHGESLKSTLVAIIVPDFDVLTKHATKEMRIEGNARELCKNEHIKQLILNDITAQGKKSGLHSFEQVKEIYLHPELFSVENGLLTPTFKSKRPALRDFFKDQITDMYRTLV